MCLPFAVKVYDMSDSCLHYNSSYGLKCETKLFNCLQIQELNEEIDFLTINSFQDMNGWVERTTDLLRGHVFDNANNSSISVKWWPNKWSKKSWIICWFNNGLKTKLIVISFDFVFQSINTSFDEKVLINFYFKY